MTLSKGSLKKIEKALRNTPYPKDEAPKKDESTPNDNRWTRADTVMYSDGKIHKNHML
ncbi:hypothetical protein AB8289_004512 [Vibrio parahaemolyticus]